MTRCAAIVTPSTDWPYDLNNLYQQRERERDNVGEIFFFKKLKECPCRQQKFISSLDNVENFSTITCTITYGVWKNVINAHFNVEHHLRTRISDKVDTDANVFSESKSNTVLEWKHHDFSLNFTDKLEIEFKKEEEKIRK